MHKKAYLCKYLSRLKDLSDENPDRHIKIWKRLLTRKI